MKHIPAGEEKQREEARMPEGVFTRKLRDTAVKDRVRARN